MRTLGLLCAGVLLLGSAGCAHEDDDRPRVDPDAAAADFAHEAFAAMDAARTCPDLEAAWATYLSPDLEAGVSPLLRCTPAVLGHAHRVREIGDYRADQWFPGQVPAAVAEADDVAVVWLDDDGEAAGTEDPTGLATGLGWLVLREGTRHHLYNVGVGLLQECLRTQDVCRFSG